MFVTGAQWTVAKLYEDSQYQSCHAALPAQCPLTGRDEMLHQHWALEKHETNNSNGKVNSSAMLKIYS